MTTPEGPLREVPGGGEITPRTAGDPSSRASLSSREGGSAAALIVVGLAVAAAMHAHDSYSWKMAVALQVWGAAVSFGALAVGLGLAGVSRGHRAAPALLGLLPWNVLLLSQLAYVGFLAIPLEVLATALILGARAPLPGRWRAFAVAGCARVAALLLILAAHPVARTLFPWR